MIGDIISTATTEVPGVIHGRISTLRRPRLADDRASAGSMNGPLYKQTPKTVLVRRLKRKSDGPLKQLSRWFVENQVGLSANLISLLFLAHASFPKARQHTSKFFSLAYYDVQLGMFGTGFDDVYLILFGIVAFTGLRAGCMEYILAPYAKWRGLARRKDITRFSEQAWLVIYYSTFWALGMYIYITSSYYMDLKALWQDWPIRHMDGLAKLYMLLQWSFWIQQVVVINIEERRKDHWQMLTHHIITIALIYSSYCYHHTRVGHVILVLMDVADILLPFAKCLKYLKHTTMCDYMFGGFMLTWFLTRHVAYVMVLHSVWRQTPQIIPYGCYTGSSSKILTRVFDQPRTMADYLEPFYNRNGLVCFNSTIHWAFLSALILLQLITIAWFVLIVQVAVKVLKGGRAEDNRSDNEDDLDYDEEAKAEEMEYKYGDFEPLLEKEVGVDDIDLQAWERRTRATRGKSRGCKLMQPSTTGVSLPGHSDRKELLGRIGCEKQVD